MRYIFFLSTFLYSAVTLAGDYTEEYYKCLRQYSDEIGDSVDYLYCINEENKRQIYRINTYEKQLKTFRIFDKIDRNNTIEKQRKNMSDYAKSFCKYSIEASPCGSNFDKKATYQECITNLNKLMAENLEDLLNGAKKQNEKQLKNQMRGF